MEHSSSGYWISLCWNRVGKRQNVPYLFSSVTKKIPLSIHIPTKPPDWGAGRSLRELRDFTLHVLFSRRAFPHWGNSCLSGELPNTLCLSPPQICRLCLPDITGFPTLSSRQHFFSSVIIGGNGFCGSVKKGHQSQIPHANPLQSQEVFIIDKINLTRYLRALLKSFISLLTQAAQED